MQVAEKTTRARIVTKAEVYKLVQNGRSVVGCEYRKAGKSVKDREMDQDTGPHSIGMFVFTAPLFRP